MLIKASLKEEGGFWCFPRLSFCFTTVAGKVSASKACHFPLPTPQTLTHAPAATSPASDTTVLTAWFVALSSGVTVGCDTHCAYSKIALVLTALFLNKDGTRLWAKFGHLPRTSITLTGYTKCTNMAKSQGHHRLGL